uniref:NADH2 peroxidase (Fragments) n=1 Tax=Enterococcus hirae TaxID=1354 RepID=Q7M1B1_ENTHR
MEKKKVIIVGAAHGGHQMSCGMELYLEDQVTDVNDVR